MDVANTRLINHINLCIVLEEIMFKISFYADNTSTPHMTSNLFYWSRSLLSNIAIHIFHHQLINYEISKPICNKHSFIFTSLMHLFHYIAIDLSYLKK